MIKPPNRIILTVRPKLNGYDQIAMIYYIHPIITLKKRKEKKK
jgi:hypothetical protein